MESILSRDKADDLSNSLKDLDHSGKIGPHAMRCKEVQEILLPYKEGTPLDPSVSLEDKIIRAIELMVTNNLRCIAVIRNNRPIGMVRLEDAFEKVGLQGSRKI